LRSRRGARKPPRCGRTRSDAGLSIIELIVALAILALLAALLVPAVHSARESSRKVQCITHLRQIGIAIGQYESVHGMFPPGGSKGMSFHVAILPFTEYSDLFQKVDYSRADKSQIRGTVIPLYRCPSESAASTFVIAGLRAFTNYGGNFGTGVRRDGYNGMFCHLKPAFPGYYAEGPIRAQDVRDGLSNTVAVAEILHFGEMNQRLRRNWNTPKPFRGSQSQDELAAYCENLPPDPLAAGLLGDPLRGDWTAGESMRTLYNHVLTPNNPSCYNGAEVQMAVSTAASPHASGVHTLYADGHVTYTSNSIGKDVWRDLGSRCSSQCGLVLKEF